MRAAFYLLIWLPVAILGCVASFGIITLSNALDFRYLPYWIGLAMNIVPAFGCGVGCYYLAGRWVRARGGMAAPTRHLLQSAPLYVISVLLTAFIWANWSDRGFGLVAQLYVWPLMATLGGICGDLLAARARARRLRPAA